MHKSTCRSYCHNYDFAFSIARSAIAFDLVFFPAFEIPFMVFLMNMNPLTADITSDITAAQSIVTILWDTEPRTMETGTKMITSRKKASNVDLKLFPID